MNNNIYFDYFYNNHMGNLNLVLIVNNITIILM